MTMDTILHYDLVLFRAINGFSNPVLDFFMYLVSLLGEFSGIFLVIIALLIIRGGEKGRIAGLWCLLGTLLSDQVLGQLIKQLWPRQRPWLYVEGAKVMGIHWTTGSFPSGHCETAFAAAVVLSHYYPRMTVPMYTFAVLTCFSRVCCGMHHPLDVTVGALVGLCGGWLMLFLAKKVDDRLLWFYPLFVFSLTTIVTRMALKHSQTFSVLVAAAAAAVTALIIRHIYRKRATVEIHPVEDL